MDPAEESAVSEIFKAARIPWSQLDGRTQRNSKGNVVKLRFSPCLELEEIPRKIGDLASLEEIYLFWASRRLTHLPSDSFDRLHNLRVLQIRWCQGIKELPKLNGSIEELVIEGCNDDVDLSSFRTAKHTWKRLRSLHIIQVGARGIASLVEAFSTEDDCDGCDDAVTNGVKSKKEPNRASLIYFPSLTSLSLRHNSIDQMDVVKLWPFFNRCLCLTNIDLGNNRIVSLASIAQVATARVKLGSKTQEVPRMKLRELNLAGNPCCSFSSTAAAYNFNDNERGENNDEDDSDNDSESQENIMESAMVPPAIGRNKCRIQKSVRQDEHLLRIITAHPQLESIFLCSDNCDVRLSDCCNCFEHSALYSPSVGHALDLNRCSRGKTLIGTRASISYEKGYDIAPTSLSLAKWPLILERANRIFGASFVHNDHVHPSSQNCSTVESTECSDKVLHDRRNAMKRALQERQASVIYSLLQGPAFAARGNQYASE